MVITERQFKKGATKALWLEPRPSFAVSYRWCGEVCGKWGNDTRPNDMYIWFLVDVDYLKVNHRCEWNHVGFQ